LPGGEDKGEAKKKRKVYEVIKIMKEIYLDNNATSRIHPDVAEAILECQRKCYGNPSSIHDPVLKAQAAVNKAKEKIAVFPDVRLNFGGFRCVKGLNS
jgi:selenocysteine lyase/cysteine desulfurase